MLQISGEIDLFRKKSCGLVETTACKWSITVGELGGKSDGKAEPVGWIKHAALSCKDCKLRLREGMKGGPLSVCELEERAFPFPMGANSVSNTKSAIAGEELS